MKNTIFVVLVCILMSACSSVGKYTPDGPQSALKSDYESVEVDITSQDTNITPEAMTDIKASVIGQLLASGRFHRVTINKPNLIISINITHYRTVSPFLRYLVWMAAGSNIVEAQIKASEGNNILRNFKVKGQSAAHPISPESGLADAVAQFSKNVLLGLGS